MFAALNRHVSSGSALVIGEVILIHVADRLLDHLKTLDASTGGYKVTRLGHSLQSATLAYRDGADEEMVVAALSPDRASITKGN